MKPKNFTGAVLLVTLVGIGLWWFMRPTTAPQKTAEAPMPAKAEVLKLNPPPTQIAKPAAPPAQTKPEIAKPLSKTADPPRPN